MKVLENNKVLFTSTLIALLSIISSVLYNSYYNDDVKLDKYARLITQHLHDQEKKVDNLLLTKIDHLFNQIYDWKDDDKASRILEQLEQEDFTLLFYDVNDSLLLWTNDNINFEGETTTKTFNSGEDQTFAKLGNAYYLIKQKQIHHYNCERNKGSQYRLPMM